MKAIILAGGKGTRLAPYTTVLPKPLMPLGDMPILEILIRRLKNYGITDITLSVGYLSSLLEAYFGNGQKLGVDIKYSYEPEPLGTAGPIGLIGDLKDSFFLMNGDLLVNLDFQKMFEYHKKNRSIATVGLATKSINVDLGIIKTNANMEISEYIEKPIFNYLVSMGVYVLEPKTLDYVRGAGRIDLPDLVKKLIEEKQKVIGYESDVRWFDIGRHEDYQRATEIFQKDPELFLGKC